MMKAVVVVALYSPFSRSLCRSRVARVGFRLAVSSARIRSIQALNVINWKVGDTENMQIAADSMGNIGTMSRPSSPTPAPPSGSRRRWLWKARTRSPRCC